MTDFHSLYWFIKDYSITYSGPGFSLWVKTDTPCHLFRRSTMHSPLKHSIPSWQRGIALSGDIRFCFTVYFDFEQVEPGDTLEHTWAEYPLNPCHTYWFYFIGTINGLVSPSESPIFFAHRDLPSWLPFISEPWTCVFISPPALESLISEPWTCNFIQVPAFETLISESWTCTAEPPPAMVELVSESWSS